MRHVMAIRYEGTKPHKLSSSPILKCPHLLWCPYFVSVCRVMPCEHIKSLPLHSSLLECSNISQWVYGKYFKMYNKCHEIVPTQPYSHHQLNCTNCRGCSRPFEKHSNTHITGAAYCDYSKLTCAHSNLTPLNNNNACWDTLNDDNDYRETGNRHSGKIR